jgi:hypothetical protein
LLMWYKDLLRPSRSLALRVGGVSMVWLASLLINDETVRGTGCPLTSPIFKRREV